MQQDNYDLGKPREKADIEKARQAYSHFITVMACLWLPFILFAMPLALYLSYSYSARSLWAPLRPFWNPIGLFIVACIPFIIVIRLSPFGRRHERRRKVIDAVLAYDAACKAFQRWKKSGSKSSLLESRDKLLAALPIMDEMPDYQALREEVEREVQKLP